MFVHMRELLKISSYPAQLKLGGYTKESKIMAVKKNDRESTYKSKSKIESRNLRDFESCRRGGRSSVMPTIPHRCRVGSHMVPIRR
jgi:hypothetical protein